MADYKKMYTSLWGDVTDAISLLQRAQQKAEELYLSDDDGVVLELRKDLSPEEKE